MHSSEDPIVPVEQSIPFDEALHASGVKSTLLMIDGVGHGFPRADPKAVKPFFDGLMLSSPSTSEWTPIMDCVNRLAAAASLGAE